MASHSHFLVPSPGLLLAPLLHLKAGLITVGATHAQIDDPLNETLATLANQGEHIALLVCDSRFDGHTLARQLHQQEHVKLSFAETPYQVRFLLQRLRQTREQYTVVVVTGLLETFYDEQVKVTQAELILRDSLHLLGELAESLRVLLILTPVPQPTRPQLLKAVRRAVGSYLELPALPEPNELQRRLF